MYAGIGEDPPSQQSRGFLFLCGYLTLKIVFCRITLGQFVN